MRLCAAGEIKFLKERSCAPATLRLQSRVIRRRIMQPVGRTGRDFIERVMDGAAAARAGVQGGVRTESPPAGPIVYTAVDNLPICSRFSESLRVPQREGEFFRPRSRTQSVTRAIKLYSNKRFHVLHARRKLLAPFFSASLQRLKLLSHFMYLGACVIFASSAAATLLSGAIKNLRRAIYFQCERASLCTESAEEFQP
jgi:hypothetical protein